MDLKGMTTEELKALETAVREEQKKRRDDFSKPYTCSKVRAMLMSKHSPFLDPIRDYIQDPERHSTKDIRNQVSDRANGVDRAIRYIADSVTGNYRFTTRTSTVGMHKHQNLCISVNNNIRTDRRKYNQFINDMLTLIRTYTNSSRVPSETQAMNRANRLYEMSDDEWVNYISGEEEDNNES